MRQMADTYIAATHSTATLTPELCTASAAVVFVFRVGLQERKRQVCSMLGGSSWPIMTAV